MYFVRKTKNFNFPKFFKSISSLYYYYDFVLISPIFQSVTMTSYTYSQVNSDNLFNKPLIIDCPEVLYGVSLKKRREILILLDSSPCVFILTRFVLNTPLSLYIFEYYQKTHIFKKLCIHIYFLATPIFIKFPYGIVSQRFFDFLFHKKRKYGKAYWWESIGKNETIILDSDSLKRDSHIIRYLKWSLITNKFYVIQRRKNIKGNCVKKDFLSR